MLADRGDQLVVLRTCVGQLLEAVVEPGAGPLRVGLGGVDNPDEGHGVLQHIGEPAQSRHSDTDLMSASSLSALPPCCLVSLIRSIASTVSRLDWLWRSWRPAWPSLHHIAILTN